jgi:chromosome segregation ATPase
MIKDFMDLVAQLYEEDPGKAILIIQITIVGIVFVGGAAIALLYQAVSNVKDENAKLKEENQNLQQKAQQFDSIIEKYESRIEKIAQQTTAIDELKSQLSNALAHGKQQTQEKEAIEDFLKKLTQLEEGIANNLERIEAGKQLSKNKKIWTQQAIKAVSRRKKPWWKKLLRLR